MTHVCTFNTLTVCTFNTFVFFKISSRFSFSGTRFIILTWNHSTFLAAVAREKINLRVCADIILIYAYVRTVLQSILQSYGLQKPLWDRD